MEGCTVLLMQPYREKPSSISILRWLLCIVQVQKFATHCMAIKICRDLLKVSETIWVKHVQLLRRQWGTSKYSTLDGYSYTPLINQLHKPLLKCWYLVRPIPFSLQCQRALAKRTTFSDSQDKLSLVLLSVLMGPSQACCDRLCPLIYKCTDIVLTGWKRGGKMGIEHCSWSFREQGECQRTGKYRRMPENRKISENWENRKNVKNWGVVKIESLQELKVF